MVSRMHEALLKIISEKNTNLCVGLDLRVPIEDRQSRALELVDQTHDLVACYKPNRNFWLGSSLENLQELNQRIHKYNLLSICDNKITDIGSTNEMALKTMSQEGFDFYTASPFPGNLKQNYEYSKGKNLGQIALVLMSNPEAKWMIDSGMYKIWAKEANEFADGVVIGTTNHIDESLIVELKSILQEQFILAPGLGSQGGKPKILVKHFGDRVVFNVSRGVTLNDNPRDAAISYLDQINQIKKQI